MPEAASTVFIVDDDEDMRHSLFFLLSSVGISTQTFASATEFLTSYRPELAGCLVCDVRMPDLSGLDLAERLFAAGGQLPVIFMTAFADVPMAIRALKSGATEFIEKPFNAQDLLERIQHALAQDRQQRQAAELRSAFFRRLATLTDKELSALTMILDGTPNKSMAAKLCISERAVEMRRASIMRKLAVHSLAELIRLLTQHETERSGLLGINKSSAIESRPAAPLRIS